MGAPNSRENELRVEKLFLRRDLVKEFDSKRLLDLEGFISFIWHENPSYVSDISQKFLRELITYRSEGKPYTQDDWVRFSDKLTHSKSSRDIMLAKLLYLGLVEKKKKTLMQYEIRLSDKWIHYLEYLAQSWVWVCENDAKIKR